MALLLNTNIEYQIKQHIVGRIARAGGSVNQLLTYKNCIVEDINLSDGGFGRVREFRKAKTIRQLLGIAKSRFIQEYIFLKHGYSVSRDRKTLLLDMHFANENAALAEKFDCSISSNLIEHSPNPIFLLLNFYFITRHGGYQYHAIPHYKYTYDIHRTPTSIAHLINDFEKMTDFSDMTHNDDYVQSAIVKHGWQRKFHEQYPVSYPYMHFHVFDESNTRELFELMFEDVVNDIIKTEEFSDNVIFYRNVLKQDFVKKYRGTIELYSENFLSRYVNP